MRKLDEIKDRLENDKVKSLPISFSSSSHGASKTWTNYNDDVYVNNALFDIGVTAVVPASEDNWLTTIGLNQIHLYGQTINSDIIADVSPREDLSTVEISSSTISSSTTSDSDSIHSDTDSISSDIEPSSKRVLTFLPTNSLPNPETQVKAGELTDFEHSIFAESTQELYTPQRRDLRHAINQNRKCLQQLAEYANHKKPGSVLICESHKSQFLIYNPERRSEVFLPISVNGMGSYICLSNNKMGKEHFSGVNNFVTAGCLFGSTFKARDNHTKVFPIVKHENIFSPGEYITSIIYNRNKTGPYEDSLFFELTKLCHLIDVLAEPSEPKTLTFHIPYYDYILYAFKLYLDGNITQKACDEFIGHIFFKKEQYIKKITELCAKHNILVKCTSPFINLFGNQIDPNTAGLTKALFDKLKYFIPDTQINSPLKLAKKDEKHFVQHCLRQLMENNLNADHRQVWQDFMKAHTKDFVQRFEQHNSIFKFEEHTLPETQRLILKLITLDANNYTIDDIIAIGSVTTLEDLLKIANAIVIGIAAKGQLANKTCAVYPTTEKIIPGKYGQLRNNKVLRDDYSPVLKVITLDPTLAYSGATNGTIFYLDLAEDSLRELIHRDNILTVASQNIHRAICGQAPHSISQIINSDGCPLAPDSASSSPDGSPMNLSPPIISSPAKIMTMLSQANKPEIPSPHAIPRTMSETITLKSQPISYDEFRKLAQRHNSTPTEPNTSDHSVTSQHISKP